MRESVISPLPVGAGRTSDWCYPDPLQMALPATAPTTLRNRLNNTSVALRIVGTGGGAANLTTRTATLTPFAAACAEMTGTGAGGQYITCTNGPLVWMTLLQPNVGIPANAADYGVTNLVARYALRGMGAATPTNDGGLQATSEDGRFNLDGVRGFAFRRPSTNQLEFCVRPVLAGAVIATNVTPAGFDETALNEYRMFFTSASKDGPGALQAFVNGRQVLALTWTAANLGVTMPDFQAGNFLGFLPQIAWYNNGFLDLLVQGGFQIVSAPSALNTQ